MAIPKFVPGQSVNIITRCTDEDTKDPFDLTGVTYMRACFPGLDGTSVNAFYLPRTANISTGLDIISGLDTTDIAEGQPVVGTGIPSGAKVIKTPTSTTSPTSAGTVQISAAATATTTGLSMVFGHISIVSAVIGKIKIALDKAFTLLLQPNDDEKQDWEIEIIKNNFNNFVQFPASLDIRSKYCD